jgi:translocation and assembly module TamA
MDAERRVIHELSHDAFPFPEIVDRQVVVDHAVRSMIVHTTIATGPRAVFGEIQVSGVKTKLADYAKLRAPWKEGDPYDPEELEKMRNELAGAGLFSTVRIRPGEAVGADGTLPILIDLERGKPRSVGVGASYSSSEGAGGSAYWEHRDLFNRAERLRIGAEAAQIGYTARLTFEKPDFLAPDQSLLYESAYEIDDTEAFESREFKTSLALERPLWGAWTGIGGISYEVGKVTDANNVETDVQFVGFPGVLRRDTSDDPLNPTRGNKLEIGLTPYVEELGSDASILISRLGDALYWPLDFDRKVVVAGRAAIGSITGAGRFVIPADKRFYAGGGGSVRGFAFQMAGPLNDDDDPLGGRSLAEVSAELRWRVWRNFGVVPFVDGGNVYAEEFPVFDNGLFWGAGLGLRYYTRVGPIRLDVAAPLNPRSGVDDPVQFYISLGQAY